MSDLDWDRAHSLVTGCPPVRYVQDGIGFNPAGKALGLYDTQASLLVPFDEPAVEPKGVYSGGQLDWPTDRSLLETQAKALGVQFRSTIGTEKLRERVEAAQNEQA